MIIDGSLYGRVLSYPSMDFVSFGTWKEHLLELCLDVLYFEKSQKLEFWRYFENGNFWGLGTLRKINRIS